MQIKILESLNVSEKDNYSENEEKQSMEGQ
jgi:hypothetical protein